MIDRQTRIRNLKAGEALHFSQTIKRCVITTNLIEGFLLPGGRSCPDHAQGVIQ